MEDTRDRVCNATDAVCDGLRQIGDFSYAILPRDIAHAMGDLKAFLSQVRSIVDWERQLFDQRVAGGDKLREEWRENAAKMGPAMCHRKLFRQIESKDGSGWKFSLQKNLGFVWRVERAVEMVEEAVEEGARPIRSLGPLIDNAQEMERLGAQGVSTITLPTQAGHARYHRCHSCSWSDTASSI